METPEKFATHLAEVVSLAIKTAGLSQRDVASRAGIPLVTLSRRLTGRSPFLTTELAAISSVVGISVVELVLRAERAPSHAA